jgi:hypothetical protein
MGVRCATDLRMDAMSASWSRWYIMSSLPRCRFIDSPQSPSSKLQLVDLGSSCFTATHRLAHVPASRPHGHYETHPIGFSGRASLDILRSRRSSAKPCASISSLPIPSGQCGSPLGPHAWLSGPLVEGPAGVPEAPGLAGQRVHAHVLQVLRQPVHFLRVLSVPAQRPTASRKASAPWSPIHPSERGPYMSHPW